MTPSPRHCPSHPSCWRPGSRPAPWWSPSRTRWKWNGARSAAQPGPSMPSSAAMATPWAIAWKAAAGPNCRTAPINCSPISAPPPARLNSWRALRRALTFGAPCGARGATLGLEALLQRRHQVDDIIFLDGLGGDQFLALFLAADQVAQGILIAVLELARLEGAGLLRDDLAGDLDHLPVGLGGGNVLEGILGLDHLVAHAQGIDDDALALRLQRYQPLAGVHHHPPQGDPPG